MSTDSNLNLHKKIKKPGKIIIGNGKRWYNYIFFSNLKENNSYPMVLLDI